MAGRSTVKGVDVYFSERAWREAARRRGNPTTKPNGKSSRRGGRAGRGGKR